MRVKSKRPKVNFESKANRGIPRTPLPVEGRDARSLKRMATRQPVWVNEDEGEVETISRDDIDPLSLGGNTTANVVGDRLAVPEIFTSFPPIRDPLITDTSISQDETVEVCLPHLTGTGKSTFSLNTIGVPRLEREDHVDFLRTAIQDARFIPYDASRPWIVYWSLTGLNLLDENVETYRKRVAETFAPSQNPGGGFGGGHGQLSHIAPSYAAVLSLAMVGGSESLDMIDRRNLWRWLGELKQSDGGFRMCMGGEEDVRGAYCSMVIMSLLALPLELPPNAPTRANGFTSLLDGLPEYLSRCQTFEGGISGRPQTEAHGAYLDLPLLISWLSARQYAPEGGFSGRTNKLVDGCYSHWVGDCSSLIEAALSGPQSSTSITKPTIGSLYSKEGLTRYILSCCQDDEGGLRDKPSTYPDAYHTCYTLAGLSSTRYYNFYTGTRDGEAGYPLDSALRWASSGQEIGADGHETVLVDAEDRLTALHPIYVIPWDAVDRCYSWFSQKTGF